MAKNGYDVSVFEKNNFAGGRVHSKTTAGFNFDFAPHFLSGSANGYLRKAAKLSGFKIDFIHFPNITFIKNKTRITVDIKLNSLINTISTLYKLKFNPLSSIKYRSFFKTISNADPILIKRLDRSPLSDFVDSYTSNDELHQLINALSLLFFVLPYNIVSAGEFIYTFSSLLSNGSTAYPRGGLGNLIKSFCDAIVKNGGKIFYNQQVRSILNKNSKVTGIETDDDYYNFDIVISNSGIKNSINLAGLEDNEKYSSHYGNYIPSRGMVVLKYGLNKKVLKDSFIVGIPQINTMKLLNKIYTDSYTESGDIPFMLTVPTNLDSSIAGENKQIILAGAVVSSSKIKLKKSEMVMELLKSRLNSLFPELLHNTEVLKYAGINDIIKASGHKMADVCGVAQTIEQVGLNSIPVKTPIKNLYLCGSDVSGRGTGVESAAESALTVAKLILS